MARYLDTARDGGWARRRLRIMQSNGGSISAGGRERGAGRADHPVGPRGRRRRARGRWRRRRATARLISFDMGGTSTDVSLVDGAIGVTAESTVGDFPVRLPVIDIHTVGAGGGSIACVDAGRRAAGRAARAPAPTPGPVCYGRGDELDGDRRATCCWGASTPAISSAGAWRSTWRAPSARPASSPRALQVPAAARWPRAIVRVANANMERAIRVVSVERGFDPREFALVAFGGAGGMHACEIADKLEIAHGASCRSTPACCRRSGMLLADVTKDYSLSILQPSETRDGRSTWSAASSRLVAGARADLASEGFGGRPRRDRAVARRPLRRASPSRLTVPSRRRLPRGVRPRGTSGCTATPTRTGPPRIVNLRVRAIGVTDQARAAARRRAPCARAAAARHARRPAWFGGPHASGRRRTGGRTCRRVRRGGARPSSPARKRPRSSRRVPLPHRRAREPGDRPRRGGRRPARARAGAASAT